MIKRRKIISFADYGSGQRALHARALAKNRQNREKQGKFVSIDTKKPGYKSAQTTETNHEYKRANVFKWVTRQPKENIRIQNDEFFIDDVFLKNIRSLNGKSHSQISQKLKILMSNYAKKLRRAATKNGRIHITVYGVFKNIVIEGLENNGFKVENQRSLTAKQAFVGYSETAKNLLDIRQVTQKADADFYQSYGFLNQTTIKELTKPIKITARKKKN